MNKYKRIINKIVKNYRKYEESELYTHYNLYNLNRDLYIEVEKDIEEAIEFDAEKEFYSNVYLTKRGNRVLRIIENIAHTVYGIEF